MMAQGLARTPKPRVPALGSAWSRPWRADLAPRSAPRVPTPAFGSASSSIRAARPVASRAFHGGIGIGFEFTPVAIPAGPALFGRNDRLHLQASDGDRVLGDFGIGHPPL